jgi:hypothetical protein
MAVSPNDQDLLLGIRNGRHELHSLEIAAVVVGDAVVGSAAANSAARVSTSFDAYI